MDSDGVIHAVLKIRSVFLYDSLEMPAGFTPPQVMSVHGGFAAVNRGAGPDTVNCTIKLRLLAQTTAPVSTAISYLSRIKESKTNSNNRH